MYNVVQIYRISFYKIFITLGVEEIFGGRRRSRRNTMNGRKRDTVNGSRNMSRRNTVDDNTSMSRNNTVDGSRSRSRRNTVKGIRSRRNIVYVCKAFHEIK